MSRAKKVLTELDEMAYRRKESLRKLDSLVTQIAIHLFRVFVIPSHPSAGSWVRELEAWRKDLILINTGKSGANNFTEKILMKKLWDGPFGDGSINTVIKMVQNDGFSIPDKIDVERFKEYVLGFTLSIVNNTSFDYTGKNMVNK